LPQISKLLDTEYRTLHTWVKRGLVRPSIRLSQGTGNPNLFSQRDAVAIQVLLELRRAGVALDLLEQAAEELWATESPLDDPRAYMTINGSAKLVFDAQAALSQIESGGVTLAYSLTAASEIVSARFS